MSLDPLKIKEDFPIFEENPQGTDLVFLDSAASTQKPQAVIDALSGFYKTTNANVHRGVYTLSQNSTSAYESARETLSSFINSPDSSQVIFTRGTTESVNLVADSWGRANLGPGDDLIVTRIEHHSNFVPWQQVAKITGANFRIFEINEKGELDPEAFKKFIADLNPKLFAFSAMSNVLGIVNPVGKLSETASLAGAKVFVDAAQSAAHKSLDVQKLSHVDFLAFSAHKMLGPTGIGVLWGKKEILDEMPPWQSGGSMILEVGDEKSTWNETPWKFEAGTPIIAGAVGFAEAIKYLENVGMDNIFSHERLLAEKAIKGLTSIDGVKVFAPEINDHRGGVVSFVVDGVHPHDLGTFLDQMKVAVRGGHHCAQPLLRSLGTFATMRASFYLYNTVEDVDRLVEAVKKAKDYFCS